MKFKRVCYQIIISQLYSTIFFIFYSYLPHYLLCDWASRPTAKGYVAVRVLGCCLCYAGHAPWRQPGFPLVSSPPGCAYASRPESLGSSSFHLKNFECWWDFLFDMLVFSHEVLFSFFTKICEKKTRQLVYWETLPKSWM